MYYGSPVSLKNKNETCWLTIHHFLENTSTLLGNMSYLLGHANDYLSNAAVIVASVSLKVYMLSCTAITVHEFYVWKLKQKLLKMSMCVQCCCLINIVLVVAFS